jgi:hypothetical protein
MFFSLSGQSILGILLARAAFQARCSRADFLSWGRHAEHVVGDSTQGVRLVIVTLERREPLSSRSRAGGSGE